MFYLYTSYNIFNILLLLLPISTFIILVFDCYDEISKNENAKLREIYHNNGDGNNSTQQNDSINHCENWNPNQIVYNKVMLSIR